MKGTDIALIIFIALLSVGISFWLGNTILGDPNDRTEKITYMDVISDKLEEPSVETFNPKAYNPTVEVYIGECDTGYTWSQSLQACVDSLGNEQPDKNEEEEEDQENQENQDGGENENQNSQNNTGV